MSEFLHAIPITLVPLLQIFVLGFLGAALVKTRVFDRTTVDVITRLVTQLFLPLLIFTKIVSDFRPFTPEFAFWYLMPLIAASTIGVMLFLSRFPARWLCPPERRGPFMLLASIQNAGYLPLVIVEALFAGSGAIYDRMLVLLFLYVMGQNPILWFVGVMISRQTRRQNLDQKLPLGLMIRQGISPPLVASLAAVTLCLLGLPQRLSELTLDRLMEPLNLLANCTVPLVMLSLGAMVATLNMENRPAKREILSVILLRLVVMPALWMALLGPFRRSGTISAAWAIILFVESLTPSATNLAVMMRRYGSEEASDFLSHALLPMYLLSLVSMSFWLTLWGIRIGF